MEIAIIGAGMAGLSCAKRLREGGHELTLFDKGRGPGGRMSTRRMEVDGETVRFDHGAQYFTARDPDFKEQVSAWHAAGIVAPWKAGGDDAWVGTPGMNAPIRAMAEDLGVRFSHRVESIAKHDGTWRLEGEGIEPASYDAAIIAVPAEQAAPLLARQRADWGELASATVSDPCWTLMLAFDQRVAHQADAIREAGPIGWAARDSAKPERETGERWVVQADPRWSADHLEDSAEEVSTLLLQQFASAIGQDLPAIAASSAHRWRFAKSGRAGAEKLWDADLRLGACGDWLIAPRVEAAFMSGRALAEEILFRARQT